MSEPTIFEDSADIPLPRPHHGRPRIEVYNRLEQGAVAWFPFSGDEKGDRIRTRLRMAAERRGFQIKSYTADKNGELGLVVRFIKKAAP